MIRRLLAIVFIPVVVTWGEKPVLEHIYPTATAVGETNALNLTGKIEPWPPKIWCSAPCVEFSFPTNKNVVHINVTTNATPGACLIRVYNDEGASDSAIFVISEMPQQRETEPNDHFHKPQLLTNFPCTINGRLDKNNDVDSYRFEIKAGEWLDARLDSYTLMAKIDGVLRLTTTDGYQLAWNHDFASLDPRLVWQAPSDQTVILQVFGFQYPAGSQIVLSGGTDSPYQLAISHAAEPPADLHQALLEGTMLGESRSEVLGVICPAGNEDMYPITFKKDEFVELRVDASEFGSDLDPWVKVEDSSGKELARNDDAEGSRDAVLEWKAPSDGDYNIVVGSLTHRGEVDWRYRLRATKVGPDFVAAVEANNIVLESSGTNELKVSTKRLRGFTNELTIAISEPPEGLSAEPVKVDAKSNEGTLKLVTKDAPSFNAPIKILVKDNAENKERAALFHLVSRSENNGVPGGYNKLLVEDTEDFWLTIKPAKEEPPEKSSGSAK